MARVKHFTKEDLEKALKGNKHQRESARKTIALRKRGFKLVKGGRQYKSLADFNAVKRKELKKNGSNKNLVKRTSVRKFRTMTGKQVYLPVVK